MYVLICWPPSPRPQRLVSAISQKPLIRMALDFVCRHVSVHWTKMVAELSSAIKKMATIFVLNLIWNGYIRFRCMAKTPFYFIFILIVFFLRPWYLHETSCTNQFFLKYMVDIHSYGHSQQGFYVILKCTFSVRLGSNWDGSHWPESIDDFSEVNPARLHCLISSINHVINTQNMPKINLQGSLWIIYVLPYWEQCGDLWRDRQQHIVFIAAITPCRHYYTEAHLWHGFLFWYISGIYRAIICTDHYSVYTD